MSFVSSVEWVNEYHTELTWETYGHGASGPRALARMHLCKFLFAELPSVSDSIPGTCLATRSSPSAEVTSGEQLLISVCMHTVCENMQDSKWLVYYLEVILPTGTELLKKKKNAPLTSPACRRPLSLTGTFGTKMVSILRKHTSQFLC